MHTSNCTATCLVQLARPFHIIQASHEFAAFFGYSAEELQGRSLKLLQRPDNSKLTFEDLIKALKSGKEQKQRVDVSKKDCSSCFIWIKTSLTYMSDNGEDTVAMLSVQEDDLFGFKENGNDFNSLPDTFQDNLNTDGRHFRYLDLQQTEQFTGIHSQRSEPTPFAPVRKEETLSCFLSRQSCKVCAVSA